MDTIQAVLTAVPGAATPKWVAYILSIVCFVGVAVQPVGFFGVFRVSGDHT